ncbi:MAG: sigma-70 family RNA polymerase sigma factor [Flavobacteriaceae bacterium]|nr:sigma-70 family RNA polymerase sigma factor [Flavobacteriaceae bacterium]
MGKTELNITIDLLKRKDKVTLQKIYNDNKIAFVNFAKNYHIEEFDSLDIYHDSIVALQDNAFKGKLDNLKSSISTYLFAIGKYKIFHLFRERKKLRITNDIEIVEKNFDYDVDLYGKNLTNQQTLLKSGFHKIGKRCKEILELFYYSGYNLDEITDILNYSDKNVLKSQKSRCIKQLKKIVFNYE